jgi:hypothetical protein
MPLVKGKWRRDVDIDAALRVARKAGGGSSWIGEGDSTPPPTDREPIIPNWLTDQLARTRAEREAASNEPGPVEFQRSPVADTAAELTGVPSIVRGVRDVTSDEGDWRTKAKGEAQA